MSTGKETSPRRTALAKYGGHHSRAYRLDRGLAPSRSPGTTARSDRRAFPRDGALTRFPFSLARISGLASAAPARALAPSRVELFSRGPGRVPMSPGVAL